jgi:hypothetical protein
MDYSGGSPPMAGHVNVDEIETFVTTESKILLERTLR